MKNNEVDPVKMQITQLAAEQPFWTAFKLTLGYYAAQTLVSLLGLCLFVAIPFIIYVLFHL